MNKLAVRCQIVGGIVMFIGSAISLWGTFKDEPHDEAILNGLYLIATGLTFIYVGLIIQMIINWMDHRKKSKNPRQG